MGCLSHLLYLIFLIWIFRFVFRFLIAPFLNQPHHPSAEETEEARRRYLAVLMPLLAKLAKSDGRVSEREIDRIERIFAELRLSPEDLRFAQETFVRAKDSPVSFAQCAETFAATCGSYGMRQATLGFLIRVAMADGAVTQPELELILTAARSFGFPDFMTAQILRQYGIGTPRGFGGNPFGGTGGSRSEGNARPYRNGPSREEDLALLGLGPNASKEEIKRAYRTKAKELHPDRLQSQGLPESMLRQASERLAAINAAYARLK